MEGATERVLECLRKEMKGVRKSAMRVLKQEMELAMEPVIEREKKQEMEPTMEQVKKKEIEPTTEPPIKRVKKLPMEPVKILEMEQVKILEMEQVKKQEMKPANERAKKKRAMQPTFSTQDAPADWKVNQRTSFDHQIKKSAEGELQLLFNNNKLPDKIYTNEKIKDNSDGSVEIKLINTISRKTIEEGPLSSMEIEIVVLDGDFGSDGHENWTEQEFDAKIVHQRKDKGPLVKGKQNITLKDGVGAIQDLRFSDNSSWIKCKKFRLGARVLQSSSNMGQVRIKEALSEAFAVRDYRSKKNKKHNLPSLDDEVWHLKKIARKGKFHTRLNDNNIHTIRDFKNRYKTNPIELKEILKDCTDQDWKAIEQDFSCVVLDGVSTVLHQGTVGMLNDNNYASSSHHKSTGLSQAICPDLAMSTNAQGEQDDFCFQNLSNGDSGRNLFQIWSEVDLLNKMNTHPMTKSSQNNNGLHSHISAVQPASSAPSDDGKLNADSNPSITQKTYNSPTTGLLPHESPGLHQGFVGMHNNYNNASLSHHNSGFLREIGQNSASWPLAAIPTYSPNFKAQWPCNGISQHQNNGYGDPGRTPPQFNGSDSLCIQSSQISNGLSPTTGQLPHESPGLHQGFVRMHNNYDNASLSHHNSGFLREISQNPASWPPAAMPTYSPQLPCKGIFQHQNNGYGDPGWTPPQFNGSDSLCIQYSQIRNGLQAQFSAAEQFPQNTVMPPSDFSNELAAIDWES